jgi:ATP-dependent Clp protease ATP-binding subunit ClpA
MEAERMQQPLIGSEHLLLALIEEDTGVAGRVMRELGVELDRAREMVLRLGGMGSSRADRINLSTDAQKFWIWQLTKPTRWTVNSFRQSICCWRWFNPIWDWLKM